MSRTKAKAPKAAPIAVGSWVLVDNKLFPGPEYWWATPVLWSDVETILVPAMPEVYPVRGPVLMAVDRVVLFGTQEQVSRARDAALSVAKQHARSLQNANAAWQAATDDLVRTKEEIAKAAYDAARSAAVAELGEVVR